MTETERTVDGYMCKTDWECELGNAYDGNKVFPSIKALKEHYRCVDECGIVKVQVRLLRVVKKGMF
jgi:hypothetical protein